MKRKWRETQREEEREEEEEKGKEGRDGGGEDKGKGTRDGERVIFLTLKMEYAKMPNKRARFKKSWCIYTTELYEAKWINDIPRMI